MKKPGTAYALKALLLLLCVSLAGCIAGSVRDSSGQELAGVATIAMTRCSGAGCEAHKKEIPVRSGTLTGYQTTSNDKGIYIYDPYGKAVAPQDAMLLTIPQESQDPFIKFWFSKSGYTDVWYDWVPEYEEHTDADGNLYFVATVPPVYLCRDDEPDSDGDAICDDAEGFYGTSPLSIDTDGNGSNDYEETFGTGSPISINTLKILHANVNVSNFEVSKNFYMMLGFLPLLEVDVNVTDPAEAAGLDMPPYQLHASPMGLGDYVLDLIEWKTPYDSDAPYSGKNHLGLASLALTTSNLAADMDALTAYGVDFSDPITVNKPVAGSQIITFSDPDGTLIELVQPGNVTSGGTPNSSGVTYITDALRTNINVSDYEVSRRFYETLGFAVQQQEPGDKREPSPGIRSTSMTLPNGHSLNLSKWHDSFNPEAPYSALNHLGIARIAIQSANLDADMKILKDKGIEFYSDPITPSGPLSILRYVCFEDPDGTVIELVQYNN